MAAGRRCSEQPCQPATKGLGTGRFRIRREQLVDRLLAQAMHLVDGLALRLDWGADAHRQALAQPEVLHAGEPDWNHGHARLDREISETLLEREQHALARSEVAFGKQRHRATEREAPADMPEQERAPALGAIDWDDPTDCPDQGPQRPVLHHRRGVREEMDARLRW